MIVELAVCVDLRKAVSVAAQPAVPGVGYPVAVSVDMGDRVVAGHVSDDEYSILAECLVDNPRDWLIEPDVDSVGWRAYKKDADND